MVIGRGPLLQNSVNHSDAHSTRFYIHIHIDMYVDAGAGRRCALQRPLPHFAVFDEVEPNTEGSLVREHFEQKMWFGC
jgi:hypothetical protein